MEDAISFNNQSIVNYATTSQLVTGAEIARQLSSPFRHAVLANISSNDFAIETNLRTKLISLSTILASDTFCRPEHVSLKQKRIAALTRRAAQSRTCRPR